MPDTTVCFQKGSQSLPIPRVFEDSTHPVQCSASNAPLPPIRLLAACVVTCGASTRAHIGFWNAWLSQVFRVAWKQLIDERIYER
ncbi:hypothetical protein BDW02DRAFT_205567 [Decorospora gaudefroyi]|uniref:Uncharacterized protein n=1 Tax=Decorospora gaudefroyi TaxID=184978 RepID=A0A6A5K5S1_9PLEO|nr:hypothetical protein BDW02DRAFT_205567 [Decorospora gaudefroyi]